MKSPGKKLFETNTGSHLWGMNHEESDYDIFHAYVANTHEFLRGTADTRSDHIEEPPRDYAVHEIGHVINHRLKGNVNFMWGIHSPYVLSDYNRSLARLRRISEDNLGKNTYHSIRGLAEKNMKKYILTKETPPAVRLKKGRIIARTLLMGVTLLNLGEIHFDSVKIEVTTSDLHDLMRALDVAYENSQLPETPEEEPFREYLEQIRWENIIESK